ncbi:hypothetical protein [uncultured Dialister sp.]|nr:hypothetical protein [uncultured Dialister sp.]
MKQKKMICALACALCLLGGGASLAAAPATMAGASRSPKSLSNILRKS